MNKVKDNLEVGFLLLSIVAMIIGSFVFAVYKSTPLFASIRNGSPSLFRDAAVALSALCYFLVITFLVITMLTNAITNEFKFDLHKCLTFTFCCLFFIAFGMYLGSDFYNVSYARENSIPAYEVTIDSAGEEVFKAVNPKDVEIDLTTYSEFKNDNALYLYPHKKTLSFFRNANVGYVLYAIAAFGTFAYTSGLWISLGANNQRRYLE